MLVVYLALIIIFGFILSQIFVYLKKNISIMGSGQQKVITIIVFVIGANLLIMTGILVYNSYYNEYRTIGDIGIQGDKGPKGDKGPEKCPPKNVRPSSEC
jgi:hypothetical protein